MLCASPVRLKTEIMPFVIRKIEPRYVCRGHVPQGGNAADCWPIGAEMEAVANGALTASLKQLASVLAAAEDIFADLTAELTSVADRSGLLRRRLDKLEERLSTIDPKKIPVRKSITNITIIYFESNIKIIQQTTS